MPLTIEKSSVMLCERDQLSYNYTIYGTSLQSVDKFAELGIQRTSCAGYASHWKEILAKASKMGAFDERFSIKPDI